MILWRLELKRTMKLLPAMLLEAAALLAVIGGIAFGVTKLLYQDSSAVQITVAVIEEEKNPLTDLVLNYVQGMESIADSCRFTVVSEKKGFSMLQDGTAAAALVLPGGMVEGIMNGNNVPVQVYFPEDAGVESALLKELTDAGVQMLRVAQAEIYGVYDTAKTYDAMEHLSVMEMEIDKYNLAFALDRLALFRTQEVSATGNLSIVQYAAASGVIFFFLLFGMACYPIMQSYSAALQKQLKRQGVNVGMQCFGKWLCGLCSMIAGFVCFGFLIKAALKLTGHTAWLPKMGIRQMGVYFVILLCITTFVFMIFRLADSETSDNGTANGGTAAILLLFFLSVIMVYFSGGFLPSVFLPEIIQKIGRFLPTAYLIEAAGSLYPGTVSCKTMAMLILYTIVFGVVAYGYSEKKYLRMS